MDDFRYQLADQISSYWCNHLFVEWKIEPDYIEKERDNCSVCQELNWTKLWMCFVKVLDSQPTDWDEQLTAKSCKYPNLDILLPFFILFFLIFLLEETVL